MTARSQQVLIMTNACDSCYGNNTSRVRQAGGQLGSQPVNLRVMMRVRQMQVSHGWSRESPTTEG